MSDRGNGMRGQRETLFEEAAQLVSRLPGAMRRVVLRTPDHEVEIEWQLAGGEPQAHAARPPTGGPDPAASSLSAGAASSAVPPDDATCVVRAPLVGTFYRAPEPGRPPFVEVGDLVEAGKTLAVVEAMKLMNGIVADVPGRVVEIYVRDAEPVEFDQPLLRLAPVPGEQDGGK